ncbi:hypothetical protein K488DRAFT_86933 [Vararia minispora EC-137]|uniref:Uncharacterized protein n=1 Tax=Vararia minispora EC-137 TaxID=1314806 RepID=A0ACB8QI68_9AGAM|nr:hypothetical protein K488DRAFT_86933 [Vararia minispora EC-137]
MSSTDDIVFDDGDSRTLLDSVMAFDPADPFAFLSAVPPSSMSSPPSSSSNDDGSLSSSPPADWSQFSTLWDPAFPDPDLDGVVQPSAPAPGTVKPGDLPLDLFASLPMDLDAFDFTPTQGLSINPSSLHFDQAKLFAAAAAAQPPPAFLAPSALRRLSVTSSSSSSGASLSPVMDFQTPIAPVAMPAEPPVLGTDPASELAQRVRQASGVTLAVPAQVAMQANAQKLPIPRLARPGQPAPKTEAGTPSSASSPQSTTAPVSPSPPPTAPAGHPAPTARTKTSHTTIERRYRTNLNARIQGLKDAVPALRVLERRKERERTGQSWAPDDPDAPDAVDARGYADGVKVARKLSKANVLGKAAEYIRVLKRREARLRREQDGLRALLAGLVGGPALLREWDAAWTAKFGGSERDELEYEGMSDDEGDDEDDEEDEGPARKRARVAQQPSAAQAKDKKDRKGSAQPAAPGEKRKRGRPRKTASDALASTPMEVKTETPPPPVVAQTQGGSTPQYLLAAFAFFSFFNPSLRSSSPPTTHHTHTGTVLSAAPAHTQDGWDFVGAFHLLVSALVFFSIVLPWVPKVGLGMKVSLPSALARKIRSFASPRSSASASTTSSKAVSPPAKAAIRNEVDSFNRLALLDALAPSARGAPDEPAQLRAALGVYAGIFGVVVRVLGKVARGRRADRGIERLQLEQRAWVRLGERAALDTTIPLGQRIQAYLGMLSHTPAFAASPSDLTTLALLLYPLAPARASKLWDRARNARLVRAHERRVLDGMDVQQAAELLRAAAPECRRMSPLGALAVLCAREDAHAAASALLVRAAARRPPEPAAAPSVAAVAEMLRVLGGREAALGAALERVADPRGVSVAEAEALVRTLGAGAEEALVGAIARVRALFPPAGAEVAGQEVDVKSARAALRWMLGGEVFEVGGEVEEARDRVVDLVVEAERRMRRRS